jgi:thioredoxin-like negative regulator of GroEL
MPCNNYDQLFDNREKWLEHELQFHHSEWWCDVPHGDSSVRAFSSGEELTNHLVLEHSFEEPQLSFLIARGKRVSLIPFDVCPFCGAPELDLRNIKTLYKTMGDLNYEHLDKSIQLQKHIGRHIQDFSLLAFLEPDEEDNQSTNRVDYQKSGSNLSSVSLDFESDVEFPSQNVDQSQTDNKLDTEVDWGFMPIPESIMHENDPRLVAFVERSRNVNAISGWTAVLERDPGNDGAAEGLAEEYERRGKVDSDGAISGLTAWLERDPNNEHAAKGLAKAYERKGEVDIDGAILGLTAWLQRDPGNEHMAEGLAKAYERKGKVDSDSAISGLMAWLEQDPGNERAADDLAKAYERKGEVDIDGAISGLTAWLERDRGNERAAEGLAKAYECKCEVDIDAAISGLIAWLDRDPGNWRAAEVLAKTKRGFGMDAQVKYSQLLLASNYGIALIRPSDYVTAGDVCFWDQQGKATRILNVFDNHQVHRQLCHSFDSLWC